MNIYKISNLHECEVSSQSQMDHMAHVFTKVKDFPGGTGENYKQIFLAISVNIFHLKGEKPALKNHKGNGLIFGDCIVSL